jgi:hypothetical protein
MYLTDILILNSGPLPDFEFKAAFSADNGMTNKGIENLLPDEVFGERFYSDTIKRDGPKTVTVKDLRKTELCNYLCESVRNTKHFEKFSDVLSELQGLLIPAKNVGAVTASSPDAPPHDPPGA